MHAAQPIAPAHRPEPWPHAEVLDALPAHIALLDARGVIVFVNQAWKSFAVANDYRTPGFGVGLQYAATCAAAEGADAHDAAVAACNIRSVLAGQETPGPVDYPCHSPHEQRWFRMTVTSLPVNAASDLSAGAIVMHVDVTENKLAEMAARQTSELLKAVAGGVPDHVYVKDLQGRYLLCNQALARFFGRSIEQMLGNDNTVLLRPEDRRGPLDSDRRVLETGQGYTAEYTLTAAGGTRTFRATKAPFRDVHGAVIGVLGISRDVTGERAAQQQMLLLQASVSQLNDMVLIIEQPRLGNADWRIRFVNDAVLRNTGFSRAELIGASPSILHGPQTDLSELGRLRSALTRSVPIRTQLLHYRKDGQPFWVEVSVVPVDLECGDGCMHFVSVERDITEHKRDQDALRELNAELESRVLGRTAELSLAREQADQANRAKSEFLATMSHEIRTPMNGVLGMIDVLHQSSLKGDQVEMVDLIRDSAGTLLAIIDHILDFSKIEAGKLQIELEPLDLRRAVEKVCALLDHVAAKRGVRLTVFVDPAIPHALCGDETRLRQVLMNLCANAITFSGGRAQAGDVSVRAVLAGCDAPGVAVDLIVADNGIGMDETTLARLFTPFSQADASTTRRFGGSGLGLAITANLVRLMGGEITVRSAPGQGATFSVRLPLSPAADCATAPADSAAAQAAAAQVAGLQCRIVGSDQPLAGDLGTYLEHAGATVARSADLAAAAAAPAMQGLSLWLVLPDQRVPDMPALRAMAPATAGSQTRFVVLGRGARRRPRAVAEDIVTVDADVLFQRTLMTALALAAGRLLQGQAALDDPAADGSKVAPPRHEARLQGRLLLVAEDNETNRAVIARQLQLMGLAADIVVDGNEALARWRSGDYALLLTDVQMPGMDGYALAAAIRAEEPAGQRMPILALTANAVRDEEARCRSAGMDGCLTKPIRLGPLKSAIEAWLGPTAPATPPRRPAPVDLDVLTALVGHDPAVIAGVLQAFRRSAQQLGLELRNGVTAGSPGTVAAAAHKFKAGASSIGAGRLSQICTAIEQACQAGGERALLEHLPGFETELNAVLDHLQHSGAKP